MKTDKPTLYKSRPGRISHRGRTDKKRKRLQVALREKWPDLVSPPMPLPAGRVATTQNIPVGRAVLPSQAEQIRQEFLLLAEQWRRETQHLSQISKKVTHPAYFRIMGMGERAVPLLLEALRDRPAHWFAALKATANTDPAPAGANPAAARAAWLEWGRAKGLID